MPFLVKLKKKSVSLHNLTFAPRKRSAKEVFVRFEFQAPQIHNFQDFKVVKMMKLKLVKLNDPKIPD